jgi:PhnB protein
MPDKPKAATGSTQTITAHLSVREAARALDFYEQAFGAQPISVHKTPNGKVMHATLKIGNSHLMLADEFPGMGCPAPQTLGGSPVVFNIQVDDVDSLWTRAVAAGARVTMPLADQFWGDRYGQVVDPFGHSWALLTHVEDVAPEELERRANAVFAQMSKKASA